MAKGARRGGKIKSLGRGGPNWRHMLAFDIYKLSDSKRQALWKANTASTRMWAKLRKIARRRAKDPKWVAKLEAWMESKGYKTPSDIPIPNAPPSRIAPVAAVAEGTTSLRFPAIGHGVSTVRTGVAGPWEGGAPPPGEFLLLLPGQDGADKYAAWIADAGDWHSSYPTQPGAQLKREFYPVKTGQSNGQVDRDGRFIYWTTTLPKWDTDAIAESIAAGEMGDDDLFAILKAKDRWNASEGVRLASCGAARQLVHYGTDFHLQDGSLHDHPRCPKSLPSYYLRADGTKHPQSLAPTRGRPRSGEGWRGGERLGLISTDGRLVLNTLGPALCAADAWREEKLPGPLDYRDKDGDEWGFLDRAIARRKEGGFRDKDGKWHADSGVTAGPDGKGLQLDPVDLAGSRVFRQLVRECAAKNPAFSKRRDAHIAAARQKALREESELAVLLAGDEMAAKDVEIDRQNGVIAGLQEKISNLERQVKSQEDKDAGEKNALLKRIANLERQVSSESKAPGKAEAEIASLRGELESRKKNEAIAVNSADRHGRFLLGSLERFLVNLRRGESPDETEAKELGFSQRHNDGKFVFPAKWPHGALPSTLCDRREAFMRAVRAWELEPVPESRTSAARDEELALQILPQLKRALAYARQRQLGQPIPSDLGDAGRYLEVFSEKGRCIGGVRWTQYATEKAVLLRNAGVVGEEVLNEFRRVDVISCQDADTFGAYIDILKKAANGVSMTSEERSCLDTLGAALRPDLLEAVRIAIRERDEIEDPDAELPVTRAGYMADELLSLSKQLAESIEVSTEPRSPTETVNDRTCT
ncbi:MAG TPA: hypothetical protein VHE81_20185 [Lacipirellulaceae bacterium]|nr:hypothetical protein [Lacipirellulaceae bacterium]